MSGLLVACIMVKSCKLLSKNSNFKFVFEVAAHIALDLDGHFSDHFYAAVATFGGRSGKEKFKVCCRSQFYIFFNNNFKFSRLPKIKRPLGHQG